MSDYSVWVLVIIIGCVVALFIAYSIAYLASNGFQDTPQEPEMQMEQKEYMRNLRYQNILRLQEYLRYERREKHARMASTTESAVEGR